MPKVWIVGIHGATEDCCVLGRIRRILSGPRDGYSRDVLSPACVRRTDARASRYIPFTYGGHGLASLTDALCLHRPSRLASHHGSKLLRVSKRSQNSSVPQCWSRHGCTFSWLDRGCEIWTTYVVPPMGTTPLTKIPDCMPHTGAGARRVTVRCSSLPSVYSLVLYRFPWSLLARLTTTPGGTVHMPPGRHGLSAKRTDTSGSQPGRTTAHSGNTSHPPYQFCCVMLKT